jgi:predicted nucleic acid-binding protein
MTADYERALLDTSVVIDYPAAAVAGHAVSAAICTITLAELAAGLHTPDPLVNAAREQRYEWIVSTFAAITFGSQAARIYARCARVCDPLDGIRSPADSIC